MNTHRLQRQDYRNDTNVNYKTNKIFKKRFERMSLFGINIASLLLANHDGDPAEIKRVKEAHARFDAAEAKRQSNATKVIEKRSNPKPKRTAKALTVVKAAPKTVEVKKTDSSGDEDSEDPDPDPEPAPHSARPVRNFPPFLFNLKKLKLKQRLYIFLYSWFLASSCCLVVRGWRI